MQLRLERERKRSKRMSSKNEIRKLAELACGTSKGSPEYRRFLEAINPTLLLDLTAPVVERQPDAFQVVSDRERRFTRCEVSAADCAKHIAQNGELNVRIEALYTAPPELAELQATIDQLTAENERLKAKPVCIYWNDKDHSCSDVERLQGEPFTWWMHREDEDPALDGFGVIEPHPADTPDANGKCWISFPLYRNPPVQPAPVSVVLPERLTSAELEELEVIEVLLHGQGLSNLAGTMAAARQFIDEIACLDKVKELNP
jgi:hypothetical protein